MRVSSVLFGSVVLAIVASACTVNGSASGKERFTESNYVVVDTQAWAGELISINLQGVPIAENGGVTVIADPNLANGEITANARVLALANTDDKANADLSISEVKSTFLITHEAGEIDITCGHGTTHGTSDGGESGCELVEIHVPIGTATSKLSVKTLSGNGKMTLEFGPATIGSITGNANGAGGDIEVTAPATQGGTISLVSEQAGDITATLPAAFSADKITIEADPDKIQVGPFTGITSVGGGASQSLGTVGDGLAVLNLVSTVFAGESGTVTLASD